MEKQNKVEVKTIDCSVINCQMELTEDKKAFYTATVVLPFWPRNSVKIIQE